MHAKKFELVNWVPTKLGTCSAFTLRDLFSFYTFKDIPVIVPENDLVVFSEEHIGRGLQEGEVELPNDTSG